MAEPAVQAPAGGGFDIRRILLLAAVSLVIVVTMFFFLIRGCAPAVRGVNNANTVIYSNLDLKDAANVIARLKEVAIPYEIREEGRSIAVPKGKADEARLALAEKNLPLGGAVGWEIFDETKMGATDFDRRIQLIRAISGELSRTIRRIQAVEDARVQIVIPETKLFAETVAPVTASVMIRLRPGASLTGEKINGIVHLVASSVENLQTENVTVVDNTGRILTAKAAEPAPRIVVEAAPLTPEEKVSVMGEEKKPVQVPSTETVVKAPVVPKSFEVTGNLKTAEAAAKQVKVEKGITAEAAIVTPARPLTREEKILLLVQAKKELERNLSGKAQEILNRFYPPNSAIVKVDTDMAGSKIKKLTAIILIDNRVDVNPNLKQATFKSVAAAVGYNSKRGDKIVVQKVPFHLATPPPEVIKGEVDKAVPPRNLARLPSIPFSWLKNIGWIIGLIATVFILVFLARSLRRGKPEYVPAQEMPLPTPAAAPGLGREKNTAVESIKAAVERNPEKIAELLRNWLTQ
jgi:flagellar M-ring protein FliF